MLENLKKTLRQEEMTDLLTESVSRKRGEDYVKSVFLDNVGLEVLGAENDPEVKQLADKLPEYDDHDESVEAAVEAETLVENYIPETNLTQEG